MDPQEAETRAVHQRLTDIFTSVFTTCDIPEHAILGPCRLSGASFLDTIAFIALKTADRRTAPYVIRVDAAGATSSPGSVPRDGLTWLRLVQPARERLEQNLEAYLKSGQLFYRSVRRIIRDEELLVWYDKDLAHLLRLHDVPLSRTNGGQSVPPSLPGSGTESYRCGDCQQAFRYEFPYTAHTRILCPKRHHLSYLYDNLRLLSCRDSRPFHESTTLTELTSTPRTSTNFHRLAHDLEHRCSPPLGTGSREGCARRDKVGKSKGTGERADVTSVGSDEVVDAGMDAHRDGRNTGEGIASKRSAFTEVRKTGGGNRKDGTVAFPTSGTSTTARYPFDLRLKPQGISAAEGDGAGSAFTSLLKVNPGRRSAFTQPVRPYPQVSLGPSASTTSKSDLSGMSALPAPFKHPHQAYLVSSAFWSKSSTLPVQLPGVLPLMPPSLSSLGLTAQNWCAKCNMSFRMTSDLVYHMRSHHKKEYTSEEPVTKRRREDNLRCAICNESFRERHHLSRHMTSHN
uniref:PR domain zinc finger protein 8 n=1 Tax=Myxine glutinosa TaxID=7769 RepID=UPI00358FD779